METLTKEEVLAKIEELKSEIAVKEAELSIIYQNKNSIESEVQKLNSIIDFLTNQYYKEDILAEKRKLIQPIVDRINEVYFLVNRVEIKMARNFVVVMDDSGCIDVVYDDILIDQAKGSVLGMSSKSRKISLSYFIERYEEIADKSEVIPKETMIERITEFTNSLIK